MTKVFLLVLYTVFMLCGVHSLATSIPSTDSPSQKQISSSADDEFWRADKRLEQKVSIIAKYRTLSAIISDLSKQTGINIQAGLSVLDWQVRDRKMVIAAKDIQLVDLMRSISRVMKFNWLRSKTDDAYNYMLYLDQNTSTNNSASAKREQDRFDNEMLQMRESFANALADLAEPTADDLRKLRADNSMLYAVSASGMAQSLKELFSSVPGLRDKFVSGETIYFDLNDKHESVRKAMLGVAQSIFRMCPDAGRPSAEELADDPGLLEGITIRSPYKDEADKLDDITSRFVMSQVDVSYSNGPDKNGSEFGFQILDPYSSLGRSFGDHFTAALGSSQAYDIGRAAISMDLKEIKQFDFGEKAVEHGKSFNIPIEIDFTEDGKNKAKQLRLEDKLVIFANATKYNVVSDSFASSIHVVHSEREPAMVFLGSMETLYSYNWWDKGPTIELQDRHWAYKRSLEIPEAWLEKWRSTFKTTGTLDICSLAEMAYLVGDDSRHKMNIPDDDILNISALVTTLQHNMSLLQFLAMLTQNQQAAIFTTGGLDLSTLDQNQMEAAKRSLNWWNGKTKDIITGKYMVNGKLIPYGTSVVKGDLCKYIFVANGKNISTIDSPKFVEPNPEISHKPIVYTKQE